MSKSAVSVVNGTPVGSGGCNTHYPQLSLPAGGAGSIQLNELSINTATCDAVVQIGSPAGTVSAGTVSPGQGSSSTQAPYNASGTAPNGAAHAATVWESAGWWNSWYNDPLNINVAGEHDYVHWRWNGGCVTEAAPGGNYTSQNWYWQSGWGENSTKSTFGQSCFSAYSQQNTVLENNIFCAFQATWVKFSNSYVSGRYSGSLVGDDGGYNGQLSGGCTGLLSYHNQLKFTENKVFIHN